MRGEEGVWGEGVDELLMRKGRLDEAVRGVKGSSGNGRADGEATPASTARISTGMSPEPRASKVLITPQ